MYQYPTRVCVREYICSNQQSGTLGIDVDQLPATLFGRIESGMTELATVGIELSLSGGVLTHICHYSSFDFHVESTSSIDCPSLGHGRIDV